MLVDERKQADGHHGGGGEGGGLGGAHGEERVGEDGGGGDAGGGGEGLGGEGLAGERRGLGKLGGEAGGDDGDAEGDAAAAEEGGEFFEGAFELHFAGGLGFAGGVGDFGEAFPFEKALDDERAVFFGELVERGVEFREGGLPCGEGFVGCFLVGIGFAGERGDFPLMSCFRAHGFGAFELGGPKHPGREVRMGAKRCGFLREHCENRLGDLLGEGTAAGATQGADENQAAQAVNQADECGLLPA